LGRIPTATTPGSRVLPRLARTIPRPGRIFYGSLFALLAGALVAAELRNSHLQAWAASRMARSFAYALAPDASPTIRFPQDGPYDRRLGYAGLDARLARLAERGYAVRAQARLSPGLERLASLGLGPVYAEKDRAGLRVEDRRGAPLFAAEYPQRVYRDFAQVPPLVVHSLLFIENGELLEPGHPQRNPAVEWDRLARVVSSALLGNGNGHRPSGGSTLATQIEKFRHSPEGRTASAREKLRQIAAATLRSYLDGPETLDARRRVVLAYLNTVPLAGSPGFGEVNGIGDGLLAWYGADLDETTRILAEGDGADPALRGLAYKQILSLFVAQRRPSHYLTHDRAGLARLTDHYLRLLCEAGVIDAGLRDAALAAELEFRAAPLPLERGPFTETKATDAVRAALLDALGESRLYDLDRFDLRVRSTLDRRVQDEVTRQLRALAEPDAARAAGLVAPRLLAGADPGGVVYSLLVYERTPEGNALRVLADTLDRPFNVNEGMKLDLGSTAKLRTLAHSLGIVADLHARYAGRPREALRAEPVDARDVLRRFVVDELVARPETTLAQLLDAALERRYSASPWEGFFTAGGLHHFRNHDDRFDESRLTVRQAFANSVNLPFVRLMRDVVNHLVYEPSGFARALLEDPGHPWRAEYVARFVEWESREFLLRFYARHRARSFAESLDALAKARWPTTRRLTGLFRALEPGAGPEALEAFLVPHLGERMLPRDVVHRIYEDYAPSRFDLHDRAYLARVHPLELWLVGFLRDHPGASFAEVLAASGEARESAYRWLHRPRFRGAQNRGIRTILEQEAFLQVHRAWAGLGYPFPTLVPSLASAIGVSADRPAALAQLMGIVQNDGRLLPPRRLEELHFAAGTPYETVLAPVPAEGRRVMRPEVARALREVLVQVVEDGTARRLRGAFARADGTPVAVGGKTGTGDNRRKTFAVGARLLDSRARNRTASFAFLLGDRHFGVITAFVDGPDAEHYEFTSSLPLQVLKHLEPALVALVEDDPVAERIAARDAR
jgi:membrane peptidoglycan carboxypeptidase